MRLLIEYAERYLKDNILLPVSSSLTNHEEWISRVLWVFAGGGGGGGGVEPNLFGVVGCY